MKRTVLALAAVCLAGLAGCGGASDSSSASDESAPSDSTVSARSSSASSQTTAAAPAGQPDRILCEVASTGTYYLWVTSGTVHNFSACDGATQQPLSAQPFDFSPTMDRRCSSSDQNIAVDHAMIGVYSSTEPADLAAAQAYCTTKNMTMG